MLSYTNCDSFPKGDLIDWSTGNWNGFGENIERLEITKDDFCMKNAIVQIPFPQNIFSTEETQICEKLSGRVSTFNTEEDFSTLVSKSSRLIENSEHSGTCGGSQHYWWPEMGEGSWYIRTILGINDLQREGQFVNMYTLKQPEYQPNWLPGRPFLSRDYNCMHLLVR